MNFSTSVTTFQVHSNLPTSARTFQMRRNFQKKLSNFARFFPTSLGSFQLQSVLSNFAWLFPTSAKLSNFRLSNLKLSNFSFFPTALSNYTYPKKSPKKSNLWPGTQDFCLDFVSRNDARWHTQYKFFEIFLDFVSENDARWRTQFLDFVSEICQYGLKVKKLRLNTNIDIGCLLQKFQNLFDQDIRFS